MNADTAGTKNMYRSARLKAAKNHKPLSSMDTACEYLFISRRLLWEIENGQSRPSGETVLNMSEVYQAPELISNYCATECPLGKRMRIQPIRKMPLERIVINAIYMLKKSEQMADALIATANGKTTPGMNGDEVTAFSEWVSELAQLSRELEVAVSEQKKGAK
ncbi:MAG: helix-turn-helix transcriptional regulator [Ruminococcaceae bacterium]|nr:helix-turn-helix transcriptional regulator [Oscillospiraceae bacterium]